MIKLLTNNIKLILSLGLILSLLFSTNYVFSAREYAKNSVLSSGKWVKVKIKETGIYKLTYTDLKEMGFENPKNVQVFGYGGNIQTENFRLNDYIDDLPQVAIWMSNPKENFGENDYILFYGKGTIKWTMSNQGFTHTPNPYSLDAFYFLIESDTNTKVAAVLNSAPDIYGTTVTTYQDYYLHQKEQVNISQTGRVFYGEDFLKNNTQTFNFSLKGATNANAAVSYEFIAYPRKRDNTDPSKAYLRLSLNGFNQEKGIDTPTNSYSVATILSESFNRNQAVSENNIMTFTYAKRSDNDQNAHLGYFRINYTRALQPYGAVTLFRSTTLYPKLNYSIANYPQNNLILDVTDDKNMKVIIGEEKNNQYLFSTTNSSIREFALIDLSKDIPRPDFVKNVNNQNLHALDGKEMVIIVQPFLTEYAERLAAIHQNNSGLQSLIVHPEDIYNEFSSGTPDVTAYRSFLKMLYDNANSKGKEAPKYLLLFGDGTFDNRFIGNNWENVEKSAFILTYQSENSTSEVNSFVSDDYFGFLDDNEGENLKNDKLDLGIGRLTVRSKLEAHNVVSKIEKYLQNESLGSWQNNILFVADDAIGSSSSNSLSERVHMEHSDYFANELNRSYPDFRTSKVYMDSYERVAVVPGKIRHPEGKKDLLKSIDSGALILNYMGHGSQNDWTHETILASGDVNAMKNTTLPLWITATCDFSRFDNNATSAGELALLNPHGGAIALFSTVRVVFASSNKLINEAMYTHLFSEEDGKPLRLGEIIRRAKTSSIGTILTDANKLRFHLLGDPAIRLTYPTSKNKIKIESINGKNPSEAVRMSPLTEITIRGSITNENDKKDQNFNGFIETNAFGNQQRLVTRGQISSKTTVPSSEVALTYMDYVNNIYSGKTIVNNGEFEFSFIVPKDVLYSGNNGKMFFTAFDSSTRKAAKGSYSNYKIETNAGSNVKETTPPAIEKLYLNQESFSSGQVITDKATLFAEISDNTGLNLAEGVGHGITATINGTSYDITGSFIADSKTAKSGKVEYQLPSLPKGTYNLVLKIWDVHNNSTTKSIDFVIEESDNLSYTFDFAHRIVNNELRLLFTTESNKADISINCKVFDKSNNLRWAHEAKGKSASFANYAYRWNLIGNNGIKLSPGTYSCVVKIKTGSEEKEKTYDFIVL